MIYAVLISFLVLLISTSAFFSASEAALFSLSPSKVNLFKRDKSYRKRLAAKLLARPKELLVTILMINVAVNIGIQHLVSTIFGTFSSWWFTVGVPLLLTLFFGEAIPKSLAISNNVAMAGKASPILYALRIILGPLRIALTGIASLISKSFFFFLKRGKEISIEELKHALKTSTERGVISQDELKLIIGSLKIEEIIVKELMRPRQEILSYDLMDPLDKLVLLFVEEECSQVPVIGGTLDEVIGVITSGSYFLNQEKIQSPEDLKQFVKEPFFVPEVVSIKKLLIGFHQKKETIALVVDEYGQISGLITKEDIVESVIGQIADKRDEEALYTRQSGDVIIANGKLDLQTLEDLFDISCESEGTKVTIGGWLTEKLGDIPKSGAKYHTEDLLFHVLASSQTRVEQIYIRKIKGKR